MTKLAITLLDNDKLSYLFDNGNKFKYNIIHIQ